MFEEIKARRKHRGLVTVVDDRRLAVALAEFEDIRFEIHHRVSHQLTIAGANVAIVVGVISFSSHFAHLPDAVPFGLVFPFAVIGWLYFEQDVFITQAAAYLHTVLRPLIGTLANTGSPEPVPLLEWEAFRNRKLFGRPRDRAWLWMMIVFRYAATVGPGLGLWIWGIQRIATTSSHHGTVGWVLYALLAATAALTLVGLGALAQSIVSRYNDIVSSE